MCNAPALFCSKRIKNVWWWYTLVYGNGLTFFTAEMSLNCSQAEMAKWKVNHINNTHPLAIHHVCWLLGQCSSLTLRNIISFDLVSFMIQWVQCCCAVTHKDLSFCSGAPNLEQQMRKRERKIEQLKRRRQLEQTLNDLTQYVKQEHADDEHIVRSSAVYHLSYRLIHSNGIWIIYAPSEYDWVFLLGFTVDHWLGKVQIMMTRWDLTNQQFSNSILI
jgi:TAP42-like family